MEIEAKYRALQRITAQQVEALDFTPYRRGPRVTHDLYDTLLDTSTLTIKRHRHRLRVRRDGDQYILALKGPVTQIGDLRLREEWEVLLGDDPYSAHTWPEEIRSRVRAFIGDAPLQEIIHVHNHRRTWDLYCGEKQVAELALDEGMIEAGGRVEAMHEVEVELKDEGSEQDIIAIVRILIAHLPLAPESRGKAKRGFALLKHNEGLEIVKK